MLPFMYLQMCDNGWQHIRHIFLNDYHFANGIQHYSNYKTLKFQLYLIVKCTSNWHIDYLSPLYKYRSSSARHSCFFLHEQRKVIQPVRQVQWVTSWQALGIGSKLRREGIQKFSIKLPSHFLWLGKWLGLCK